MHKYIKIKGELKSGNNLILNFNNYCCHRTFTVFVLVFCCSRVCIGTIYIKAIYHDFIHYLASQESERESERFVSERENCYQTIYRDDY